MSQSLTGGTDPLCADTPVTQPFWSVRTRLCLAGQVFRNLFLGFGLICAVATTVSAQQAQTIKSEQPIKCGEKDYQLRLLTATVPIKNKDAKALAIVLTPHDASESKVFGVYWVNPQSQSPTHRDNTAGILKNKLVAYGNGLTSEKVPVVESFFATLNCSSADVQVIGTQRVFDNQNLLDSLRNSPSFDLPEVAQQLNSYGVNLNPEMVQAASAGSLDLFKDLSDETEFAKAIRQYVSNVLAAEGRLDDQVGHKPSVDDEKKALEAINKDLENKVKQLEARASSLFGAAPWWLIIGFFVTAILSAAGIAVVGHGVYTSFRGKGSGVEQPTPGVTLLQSTSNAGGDQTPPNRLAEIVTSARNRQHDIEKKYSELGQIGKAQNNNAPDKLADKILQRLDLRLSSKEQKNARGIIEQALHPVTSVASHSQQRADELCEAYVDLQNELEEFQKGVHWSRSGPVASAPGKPSSPDPAESAVMATLVQDVIKTLNGLVSTTDGMKSSVDGFNGKLAQRFEGNQALQNIWHRLYHTDYSGAQIDKLVKDIGEIIDLYNLLHKRCAKPGAAVTQTMGNLQQALNDLDSIRKSYLGASLDENAMLDQVVARVKLKMGNDAGDVKEFKEIEQSVRTYFAKDVKAKDGVRRLIEEQSAARQKLNNYHPGASFTQTIDAVVSSYDAVFNKVNEVLANQNGTITERVTSLANGYASLKPKADRAEQSEAESKRLQQQLDQAYFQLEAGKELVDEIALQLNFKTHPGVEGQPAITATLNRLKDERESSSYIQLRMGLSSALIALDKAISANSSAELAELIKALMLDKVKKGVKELLAEMEDCSGEELWTKALSEGFNQQWLHYLIRADLLLRTYYAAGREFGLLRKAVSLACSASLATLHEFQVEVVDVGLFEKLPTDMETEPVYPGLRNLQAVRDKVGRMVQNIQTEEVVVDVTSFPILIKGVQANRGRASLANPSAWLQH